MTFIKKIEVKGLFGAFNHPIPLNLDEGITLILGENGLGKTQILKLIKAFFDRSFFELQLQIFDEFSIWFTNNQRIIIQREVSAEITNLHVRQMKGAKKINEYTFKFHQREISSKAYSTRHKRQLDIFYPEIEFEIRQFIPRPIERVGHDRWVDANIGQVFSTNELLEKYARYLPQSLRVKLNESVPLWLMEVTDVLKIKLIETQRLLTKIKADEGQYKSSVVNYSQEIVETIKNKRVAAIDLASKLDRTYPNRVIKRSSQASKLSDVDLQEGFTLLEKKRDLLNKVGLIDIEEEYIQPIQDVNKFLSTEKKEVLKDVLNIYIQDSTEKLSIYDDLARKIELLIAIINKRFLYKKLRVDKNKGFVFTSSLNGRDIPLSGLSSGEQHELVLYFQLLFATEPNSVLLIDEPEISLHISWQKEFINDLREVIKINNLSVIIATHSPDIIGNYWNLAVQLKGV